MSPPVESWGPGELPITRPSQVENRERNVSLLDTYVNHNGKKSLFFGSLFAKV